MKTRAYSFLFLFAAPMCALHAQNYGELNTNDIRARFYANGLIGMDPVTNAPHFEVPNGSGTNALFSAGLWMSGFNSANELRLCAMRGEALGEGDYYTGPLTVDGGASTDSTAMADNDRVWSLTASEVETQRAYCACVVTPGCDVAQEFPGYTVPADILDWPGNGNFDGGFDPHLAPYVDFNADGVYAGSDCDRPCVIGDRSLFFVFNDNGGMHLGSGGLPIGLEVGVRPFAFEGPSEALRNTVFVEYRIVNRGAQTLTHTYLGLYTDFDLGCGDDDYIGCDVGRSMWYGYNGDDMDEFCSGNPGYGADPPAFGATVLCGPFADYDNTDEAGDQTQQVAFNGYGSGDGIIDNERIGLSGFSYWNRTSNVMGDPATAAQHRGYMDARWKDDQSLTYGGTGYGGSIPARYAFPGDTDPLGLGTAGVPQPAWTEVSAANIPFDRRGLGNMGPFTLEPGAVNRVVVAFTYARAAGGGMASVSALQARVDSIRTFADQQNFCGGARDEYPCFSFSTGIREQRATGTSTLTMLPVPTTERLTVVLPATMPNAVLTVLDATGRTVLMLPATPGLTRTLEVGSLANGHYVVQARTATEVRMGRFVKE